VILEHRRLLSASHTNRRQDSTVPRLSLTRQRHRLRPCLFAAQINGAVKNCLARCAAASITQKRRLDNRRIIWQPRQTPGARCPTASHTILSSKRRANATGYAQADTKRLATGIARPYASPTAYRSRKAAAAWSIHQGPHENRVPIMPQARYRSHHQHIGSTPGAIFLNA